MSVICVGNLAACFIVAVCYKNCCICWLSIFKVIIFRVVQDDWMALDSDGKVRDSACFASGWYDNILQKVIILKQTNLGKS